MLIDNEKLIGLLVENSGLEQEKVEKQLAELVSEIKKALEENEAYEVEGFGIFSKLGNNIHFIPSEDLETEINYKYVGMEPIELPGSGDSSAEESTEAEDTIEDDATSEDEDENPIEGLLDESTSKEYEDPFAEIFSELDEEEAEEDAAETEEELEEDEIDFSALEGDGTAEEEEDHEEDPFGGLDDDADESIEDMDTTEESTEEDTEIEEIAPSGEFLDDSVFETEDESGEEEEAPGPDKWGIDAHKEEDTENAFAGLLGANAPEEDATENEDTEEEEDLDFSELDSTSSDDFDDPFDELEEDEQEQDDTLDDFVPVVTNVSSGKKAKSNKKDTAKEEETAEADEEAVKLESKTPKSPRDRKQGSPVFLYMILALVVLGGAGYGLAYFGIINIQGITPASNTTQQPTVAQNNVQQTPPPPVETPPATQQPTATEQEASQPVEEPAATSSEEITNQPDENTFTPENRLVDNENETPVEALATNEAADVNADTYGLMGSVTDAGNNGYTIVLYTLSRQDGAETQYQRLTNLGYRTMIIERPSDTYGVLYRVAIGQFASLADAAIAAEKLDADFLGNYLIAKI